MFENFEFVLLSNSPRRAQLIKEMGVKFSVIKPNVEEFYPEDLPVGDIPMYLSKRKVLAYQELSNEKVVRVAADTIVVVDGRVLGKPRSRSEACVMLRRLSDKTSHVITGVTIAHRNNFYSFSEITDVTFLTLSDCEIKYYVDNFRPYDKAGAYGIQEWIGMIGIKAINGCFYNVMGLPVSRLYHELKKMLMC